MRLATICHRLRVHSDAEIKATVGETFGLPTVAVVAPGKQLEPVAGTPMIACHRIR
jgi:hypothetical protein